MTSDESDRNYQRGSVAAAEQSLLSDLWSPRSRRQLGLFFAGTGFFAISSIITRRSLVRRHKASIPAFYHPNNHQPRNVSGALDAVEALNIATINVLSIAMMLTGGLLWSFDISSMEDLRRKVRGGMGVDVTGNSAQDAEEELEEWLASVLARKDEKKRKAKSQKLPEGNEVE